MDIHISFQPEILGTILGMPISNSLLLSVITASILMIGGFLIARSLKTIPEKAQSILELIVESILDFMDQILLDKEQAKRFFPLIASIFLFILFNNWIGILPGIGSLGFFEYEHGEKIFVPLFRSANSDLNTTLTLGVIAVLATQFYGIKQLGFFTHLSKFFVFTRGPIHFFVGILELVSEFAKIISFSFRLFGNIFAGEVLLVIIMTLMPILAPFPFLFLELFVGFIQALVFAVLTLIFLKVAVTTVEH